MNPGSNLLKRAMRLIAPSPFKYFAYAMRATSPNGQFITTYGAPVNLLGSVQAVPRNLYQHMGLDFQKNYKVFYVAKNILDVQRDVSGDMVNFAGQLFQCLSITDWYAIDGWDAVIAVQIPAFPLIVQITPPANGNYVTGQQLLFTVKFNQPVLVFDAPFLILGAGVNSVLGTQSGQELLTESGQLIEVTTTQEQQRLGGNAVYTGGGGTDTLTFSYTIQSGYVPDEGANLETEDVRDIITQSGQNIVVTVKDYALGITVASPLFGTITDMANTISANCSFVPPDLSGVTVNA